MGGFPHLSASCPPLRHSGRPLIGRGPPTSGRATRFTDTSQPASSRNPLTETSTPDLGTTAQLARHTNSPPQTLAQVLTDHHVPSLCWGICFQCEARDRAQGMREAGLSLAESCPGGPWEGQRRNQAPGGRPGADVGWARGGGPRERLPLCWPSSGTPSRGRSLALLLAQGGLGPPCPLMPV